MDNSADICENAENRVKESKNHGLKTRLRTLIKSKGISESSFYKSLGLGKQYWYGISWGLLETPQPIKIKIAKALDSDTSVIWFNERRDL